MISIFLNKFWENVFVFFYIGHVEILEAICYDMQRGEFS